MAKKQKIEISADWAKDVASKRKELQTLGFKGAGSKIANTKAARNLRREIARLLTKAATK